MRIQALLAAGLMVALAACSGDNGTSLTSPSSGGGSGSGSGSGGTGGGTGGAAPNAAAVTVGNIFFRSVRNGSANAAVDTVAAGGTVTWTWATTGSVPHSVQSVGSPSFTSSAIQTGSGSTYQATFTAPGTYQYDCAVHGTMMTGTIVVR
jgi:plastocyanin